MGTISQIIQSAPQLAANAFTSYFEPLSWSVSFFKGLARAESPSKSILRSEIEKIKSTLRGRKWYSIHESIDIAASNAIQRAAFRQARINLVYSSNHKAYESLFKKLYSNNAALASISKELYVRSIKDLNVSLANIDTEHTYNIIILDEAHRSLATENIEAYRKIIKATKNLSLAFTANPKIIEIEEDGEYINFSESLNFSEADITIGAKALQLKIEEFISSMPGPTNKSTERT